MEWEKIVANDVTSKNLISKIYELIQLNNNNQKTQITQLKKMGRKIKQTFIQKRHADGQQAHEKMHNIDNYYRNSNQNYGEVPPHTGQNGHH